VNSGSTSTTARTLRRFRRWLFALTLVALGLSSTVFVNVHNTIDTATRRTLPAVMAVSSAGQVLAEADSYAMNSFGADTVKITGPGGNYQAQIILAGQSLEQAAETNQAGEAGSQSLLLIDGQFAAYRQLVEQAHADYAGNATELGFVEVLYASRLMHDSVLTELSTLRQLEEDALTAQVASVWMTPWAVVMWAVPILGLLVLLIVAQIYLCVRFRRMINGWLMAATVALILATVGIATTLPSERSLHNAQNGVDQLVHDRTVTLLPVTAPRTASAVLAALNQRCVTEHVGCAVANLTVGNKAQVDQATTVTNQANAADSDYYLEFAIPAVGLVVAALVLWGFQRRIEDYRRRTT
jgi:hypothetical protein